MKTFLLALLFSLPAYGQDPYEIDAPGGVVWKRKNRVVIEKPIQMTGTLILSADEIVVQAPITTRGYPLEIEARKIIFEKEGRIRAFDEAAAGVEAAGAHPTPAASGTGNGGPGQDGGPGLTGYVGRPGMGVEGKGPDEIIVFAGDLEGTPIIDGTGQKGGPGGKGGVGQTGGTGAKGSKANAKLIGSDSEAGQGGRGGAYGRGGRGGDGGKGGTAVPISWLMARDWKAVENSKEIFSKAGAGGDPGEPGEPGQPGAGGPGGDGDVASFWFFTDTKNPGPAGPAGTPCPFPIPLQSNEQKAQATMGYGNLGASGPDLSPNEWELRIRRTAPLVVQTFPKFEKERYQVAIQWFEFHWWRLFEQVTRTSLDLLVQKSNADEASVLDKLLGGKLDKANLDLIAYQWERVFLQPIRAKLREAKEQDPAAYEVLRTIDSIAGPFTEMLQKTVNKHLVSKEDLEVFKKSVADATSERSKQLKLGIKKCSHYVDKVLKDPSYEYYLLSHQSYFEIPVCHDPKRFLSPTGIQGPIVTAINLVPSDELGNIPGVKIEKFGPTDFDTHAHLGVLRAVDWAMSIFSPLVDQLVPSAWADGGFEIKAITVGDPAVRSSLAKDFMPREERSSALGDLGLHKGYRGRDKVMNLADLVQMLHQLAAIR